MTSTSDRLLFGDDSSERSGSGIDCLNVLML